MKRFTTTVVVALSAGALAVPALAEDGGRNGQGGTGEGEGGRQPFSCEHARQRVTQLDKQIAKLQSQVERGSVKRPERAARAIKRLQELEQRINAVIAQRCASSSTGVS